MDATIKATTHELVIRLDNGSSVSTFHVQGDSEAVEAHAAGGKCIYRGLSVREALRLAIKS